MKHIHDRPIDLSIQDARKLVLLSQWLPHAKPPNANPRGGALEATLATLRHLGYIQIDTISVIERAHHHTIWNRAHRYRPAHLEQLLAQRRVFEYWSHAAAYLPMDDYRFSLPQMRAYANGRRRHWYAPDRKMMRRVVARIAAEGALRAQDFEAPPKRKRAGAAEMWNWKPAKQALEQLFMEGKLMTARRQGFQKVYDLAERVLPSDADTRMPRADELGRFAVARFLQANGLGRATEIAYQQPALKPLVERSLARMQRRGEVVAIRIGGIGGADDAPPDYALADATALLERRLIRRRLKILSPFDNLLIQRKRAQRLFDFDYRIECYTPAAQRKHGYFSLPLLWDGRLAARMDCKADRQSGDQSNTLLIRNFVSEAHLTRKEDLVDALAQELRRFAAFNQCERIEVGRLHDRAVEQLLRAAMR
ncbi:MAG: winged helix-turn-helix domain-containing protein [bacterium]